MQTRLGIALGIVIGLGIIYLPLLIHQAMVPNPTLLGTGDEQDRASTTAEIVEEDVFQGERLPILIAIIGLGVGIAYTAYLLARGRQV